MKRREFLGALAALASAPVVSKKRVYSFLWDNPLVAPAHVLDPELLAYARYDAMRTAKMFAEVQPARFLLHFRALSDRELAESCRFLHRM